MIETEFLFLHTLNLIEFHKITEILSHFMKCLITHFSCNTYFTSKGGVCAHEQVLLPNKMRGMYDCHSCLTMHHPIKPELHTLYFTIVAVIGCLPWYKRKEQRVQVFYIYAWWWILMKTFLDNKWLDVVSDSWLTEMNGSFL